MFIHRGPIKMQFCYVLTGLIVSIVATGSDTIHYTNSPSHLTPGANYTAYKLDVPGTSGITIIETLNDTPESDDPVSLPDGDFPVGSGGAKKMVFAPDLLNKFMEEYNAKQQSSAPESDRDHVEEDEHNSSSAENRRVNRVKTHSNRRPPIKDNPFDDKEGWVTLEAVPWSRSKVSKWKPNTDKKTSGTMSSVNLYNVRPVGSLENSHVYYGIANSEPQFSKFPTKGSSFYSDTHKTDGFYDRNDLQTSLRPDRHRPRPLRKKDQGYYNTPEPELEVASDYDRWYDYGFRPNSGEDRPGSQVYHTNETPKPPRKGFLSGNRRHTHRDQMHNSGGYSSEAYDYHQDDVRHHNHPYQDRPESVHPVTHPSNGNGEWVLVSSTKGYQYPTRRQRGITFSASPTPSNYSIRSHKALKLTVLPAKATGSNQPSMMVTHGGLLEVDSATAQQTVENSVLEASKKKKHKSKKKSNSSVQSIEIEDSKPDSTAVLAAVGAGMVPATVAMIMPMLGRRKRALVIEAGLESHKELY